MRKSKKWYGLWPLDAYVLGPFEYKRPLTEEEAREEMTKWAGKPPRELWPAK